MRRSIEEALLALDQHVAKWGRGDLRPEICVFVYPPEWEAAMLARFPVFARECREAGRPIRLIDVGQGFLAEIEKRPGFVEKLAEIEAKGTDRVLNDLGVIAARYVTRVLKERIEPPVLGSLLINTGALGVFVSYSAITNDLIGSTYSAGNGISPSVLAFPGEGDERSLNLFGLRADTNYRVPRC